MLQSSRLLALIALIQLLSIPSAHAWGLHYLITDRALKHPSVHGLDELIPSEPMEAFLKSESTALAREFDGFYDGLAKRGSKRFIKMSFDAANPSRENFLRAARLNPEIRLEQVERLLPGAKLSAPEIQFTSFATMSETNLGFEYRFQTSAGRSLPARAILSTFVDEPDWGMDRGLWSHHEYGYGQIPYGNESGISSQAPFHMQFANENLIVRLFAKDVLEGMVLDRIELFSRLARFAFKSGHPYWGYRFTAWTMHYVQDLSQPYHSKAVPSADWKYYLKFMISGDKEKMKKDTTQLVSNRHFAYEDFVAHGLQESYLRKDQPLFQKLAQFLDSGDAIIRSVQSPQSLMEVVTNFAANHARQTDAAIVRAFGPRLTEDPSYDLESDKSYKIENVIQNMDPAASERILRETGKDFEMTGKSTRTLLELIKTSSR